MTRLWECPKCGRQLQTHNAVTHAAHRCTPHTRTPVQLTPIEHPKAAE